MDVSDVGIGIRLLGGMERHDHNSHNKRVGTVQNLRSGVVVHENTAPSLPEDALRVYTLRLSFGIEVRQDRIYPYLVL